MQVSTLPRRALCLSLVLAALGCKNTVTLVVERDEIQKRVAARFPVQRATPFGTVVFENPNVILREGSDRIGVELDVKVQVPLLPAASGKVAVSGTPLYRREEKAFYLHDAKLERLEVAGLPQDQLDRLRAPVEAVAAGALYYFPVYQLEQRDWKEVGAEHALKDVSVQNGKLKVTLGL
jgi:hypothetical protein